PLPAEPKAAPKLPDDWRYVGCFKRRFAMFETPKGILMMSISAALKRVRYEEILASLGGSREPSQTLLVPISLKFDRGDGEYFSANRAAFEGCGFSIEDFGKNFYRITAIPAWLEYSNAENFVRDFVEVAREESRTLKKAAMSNADFARALVGRIGAASFECNAQSAGALLARLLSCANHISSPDGRAAVKEISEAELARMFG
ncbi:MAG: hypothetical protein IJI37_06735, partial [Opitutales bacterium]|nr:hypothetical protein [Opitutales bacterium]